MGFYLPIYHSDLLSIIMKEECYLDKDQALTQRDI